MLTTMSEADWAIVLEVFDAVQWRRGNLDIALLQQPQTCSYHLGTVAEATGGDAWSA